MILLSRLSLIRVRRVSITSITTHLNYNNLLGSQSRHSKRQSRKDLASTTEGQPPTQDKSEDTANKFSTVVNTCRSMGSTHRQPIHRGAYSFESSCWHLFTQMKCKFKCSSDATYPLVDTLTTKHGSSIKYCSTKSLMV